MVTEVVAVHANEELPDAWDASVFLAGPTPRTADTPSWRPEAMALLRERWKHDGRLVVLSPEPRVGFHPEYTYQIAWEDRALNIADTILFWVPRDLEVLPAFTTNIEWGAWCSSGKAVFGAPPEAERNDYLLHYARTHHVPTATTLAGTVDNALAAVGSGSRRAGGERDVPLLVWRTDSFHNWYEAQRLAGNTLEQARLRWTFRVGPEQRHVMCWALHASVRIAAEDRLKDNEIVISRPDAAQVALYRPAANLDDTDVVLVREFRTPASSPDGHVHELPGGSSLTRLEPLELAIEEVREETGLSLSPDRLRALGSRQVAATATAHHAHLFAAEITTAELERLRAAADRPHGVASEGERTWIEITTYGELRKDRSVDWATLGMVTRALNE